MANDYSALVREIWAPQVQELATKRLVAKSVCDMIDMPDGIDYHKPYTSDFSAGTYTPNATTIAGGATVNTEVTTTDETLSVNITEYVKFYVDRIDEKDSHYKAILSANGPRSLRTRTAYALANSIDAAILGEYANAAAYIDGGSGSIGGTLGQPIDVTADNIFDVVQAAKYELHNLSTTDDDDWVLILDPLTYTIALERQMLASGFNLQDQTLRNGFKGKFSNCEVYVSQNLSLVATGATPGDPIVRHNLLMKKGSISLAMSLMPQVDVMINPMNADGSGRIGKEYLIYDHYGYKTFTDGSRGIVDIKIHEGDVA